MGIPIDRYIDISATNAEPAVGLRSVAGLVFTTETAADDGTHTDTKCGDLTVMTFADAAEVAKTYPKMKDFAESYFAARDVNGSAPKFLSAASYSGDAVSAYSAVANGFGDFGSFCFFEETSVSEDVAKANIANGIKWVYVAAMKAGGANEADGIAGTHVVDAAALRATVMGWIGARDYDADSPCTTIDYREFAGVEATVEDGTTKDKYDKVHINFMGRVQQRGIGRTFYQTGVNCDGMDLGTYVDAAWVQSEIEKGWFTLSCAAAKVPANDSGLASALGIVVDAAEAALSKGAILANKELDDSQVEAIRTFVGASAADAAVNAVNTVGYFADAKFVTEGNRRKVRYTLVYAKGDHVAKVGGSHLLV